MLGYNRTANRLCIGGFGAALFVAVNVVAAGQSPAQTPSEKNMFIETPAGWKAPKTAWGDPDLQGTWPINYVGGVPLERCAGGFGGRDGTPPPPCDPNKAFYTEEEFKARVDTANGRGSLYSERDEEGTSARRSTPATPTRRHHSGKRVG